MDPIADLVHSYADAVCRFDPDQWAANWTDDAEWDMGQGAVNGPAVAETWNSVMATMTAVVHLIHNGTSELDLEAGAGTGRWYITEQLRMGDGADATLVGWYDDTYRLVDGRWRFARRVLQPLYMGPPDFSGVYIADFSEGPRPLG
ncbi:MAG: nuclear transport factor 2 family protein [Acidimicrobiia bacterium]|nr:nuclear transport factor 2 family protein [Acidimicrobiia bacterium]